MTGKALYRQIIKLGEALDRKAVLALLQLRLASQAYTPFSGQLSFDDLASTASPMPHKDGTPWDIIATGQEKAHRTTVSELARSFPLPSSMLDELKKLFRDDREKAQDLIRLLSQVTCFGPGSAEESFHHFLQKEWNKEQEMHGDLRTPHAIIDCILDLLDIHGGSIYDPCCGSGAMLLAAAEKTDYADIRLYGQPLTDQTSSISKASLAASNAQCIWGGAPVNTLVKDLFPEQKFDYILANPPFNQAAPAPFSYSDPRWCFGPPPRANANFAWLQHVIYHMKDDGQAAVIMPNSSLTSATIQERGIREEMIRSGIIEAVITFPKNLFFSTEIPFCLWLLKKNNANKEHILVIDAAKLEPRIRRTLTAAHTDQLTQLITNYRRGIHPERSAAFAAASLAQIAKHDFVLSPNLYVLSGYPLTVQNDIQALCSCMDTLQGIPAELKEDLRQWRARPAAALWTCEPLSDLYEIMGGMSKPAEAIGHGYPMADTAVIVKNCFLPQTLSARIEASVAEQHKYHIQYGDILLNRTSESVHSLACCCVAAQDHNAVFSGYTKRLRPIHPDKVYPLYMAGYFLSDIYRKQIHDLVPVHTTRANINNTTLSKIRIYYPEPEMQRQLGDTLYRLFQAMQSPIAPHQRAQLQQLQSLLIGQFITRPIMKGASENHPFAI